MALFARKLEYAAHDGESGAHFLALIELSGRKGGRPKGFVLYRYTVQYGVKEPPDIKMINLRQPKNAEEAREYFVFRKKSKFPGHRSIFWKKTTKWLYFVAVGGGYQHYEDGTWVRVPTPSPWSKRRKKKKIISGSTSHLLLVEKEKQRSIANEIFELQFELSNLESYDDLNDCNYVPDENIEAYKAIEKKIENLEEKIDESNTRVLNIKDELRFALARKFGKPYFPRDMETGFVRALAT